MSATYFGAFELLKETFATFDGTVSKAGILVVGSFAGECYW